MLTLRNNTFCKNVKLAFLFLVSVWVFTSCKKDDAVPIDESSALVEHTADETAGASMLDNAVEDITSSLQGTTTIANRMDAIGSVCNVSAAYQSKSGSMKTYKFTFTGNDCNNKYFRTGEIQVSIDTLTKWNQAGSVLKFKFVNFQVKVNSSNLIYTLNGSNRVTNINGGLVSGMPNGSTIIHEIKTDTSMRLTFPDGSVRTWDTYRTRTFNKINNQITLTIDGKATIDGKSKVAFWGTNRRGTRFTTEIPASIVWDPSNCVSGPLRGAKIHTVGSNSLTVQFGIDNLGNIVNTGCPWGYQVYWTGLGSRNYRYNIAY